MSALGLDGLYTRCRDTVMLCLLMGLVFQGRDCRLQFLVIKTHPGLVFISKPRH